jgi:hypothetical protein
MGLEGGGGGGRGGGGKFIQGGGTTTHEDMLSCIHNGRVGHYGRITAAYRSVQLVSSARRGEE